MAATAAGQQTQQQLRTTEKDSDFIIVTPKREGIPFGANVEFK